VSLQYFLKASVWCTSGTPPPGFEGVGGNARRGAEAAVLDVDRVDPLLLQGGDVGGAGQPFLLEDAEDADLAGLVEFQRFAGLATAISMCRPGGRVDLAAAVEDDVVELDAAAFSIR